MGKGLHRDRRSAKTAEVAAMAPVDDAHTVRERERARELRASQWWKNQLAAGKCHYCGRSVKPSELTMDHVIPVSRGGKSDRNNVVPCCKECNTAKKNRISVEDILDSLA